MGHSAGAPRGHLRVAQGIPRNEGQRVDGAMFSSGLYDLRKEEPSEEADDIFGADDALRRALGVAADLIDTTSRS